VLEAARDLGYRRAGERRGRPRIGTSQLIELVLNKFDNQWAEEITAGARAAASAAGYDLVLTSERDTPEEDWDARARARGSAGVILGTIRPTRGQLELLAEAGIPVIVIEPPSDVSGYLPSIGPTDHAGGRQAALHLLECGARHLIVVGGLPPLRHGRARVDGFTEAAHEAGVQVDRVDVDWSGLSTAEAVAPLLRAVGSERLPVGIFGCTDGMAAHAMAGARSLGLVVPDDVLVVGFDDSATAKTSAPPLTSVRQPTREIAARAVRMLLAARDGHAVPPQRVELTTELIVRESTSPQP